MLFSRQVVALILLTLWFPVTQHCDLEAAGLFATTNCDDCVATDACADDSCSVIEMGLYRSGTGYMKVPAPALSVCDRHLCLFVILTPTVDETAGIPHYLSERPRAWVPIWHVARRATPLSRAPDEFNA